MNINKISVHNYRSMRNVEVSFPPFCVLVGINAAGKSNFCDSLDFLAEVYRHGLRVAVARKGGYESICYRRARRSKGSIEFHVDVSFPFKKGYPFFLFRRRSKGEKINLDNIYWRINHFFNFKAESEKIGADFKIIQENVFLSILINDVNYELLSFIRHEKKIIIKKNNRSMQVANDIIPNISDILLDRINLISEKPDYYQDTELFITYLQKIFPPLMNYCSMIGSFRIYQISPRYGREPGVPIPQPELERFGSNLPTILAYFRDNEKRIFKEIVSKMRSVIPELENIDINYVYRKRYGLVFKEKGIPRPWTAEDVSDGTIQILAMLAAVLDPRAKLTIIEEPENSVHSWILSNFIQTCRDASLNKYIFLTTHSISLMDILKPEELFVVFKISGETRILKAVELDADLRKMLEEGHATLGEYIHSGGIPKLVPPGEEE